MELYLELNNSLTKDESLANHHPLLNEAATNHKVFKNQKEENIISYVGRINDKFNGKLKFEAIQELINFLPQCSEGILNDNFEKWIRMTSSVVTSPTSPALKKEACVVLSLLFDGALDCAGLRRHISTRNVSDLIPKLISADDLWKKSAYACLLDYVVVCPQHFITFKNEIEQSLFSMLDTQIENKTNIVSLAGRIYAALPSPNINNGNTKASGSVHKISNLISLAHSFCDILFENVIEKQSYDYIKKWKTSFSGLENIETDDSLKQFCTCITRLVNVFTLIHEQFNVTTTNNNLVTFKPSELLSPIIRVLQIEIKSLIQQKGQEHLVLALLMPSLHERALKVLLLLLSKPSVAYSLDEYWDVIKCQMVMTIRNCDKGFNTKANIGVSVKQYAYDVLTQLIKISSGHVSPTSDMVSAIVNEITPTKKNITLQNIKGSNVVFQSKKKKGKKAVVNTSFKYDSNVESILDNSSLIKSALNLANAIFRYSIASSTSNIQDLRKGIMKVAEIIFLQNLRISDSIAYSDGSARAALLKVLISSCKQPSPESIPSYIYIYHIINSAMTDSSSEVLRVCQNGIHDLSFIMSNPSISSMQNSSIMNMTSRDQSNDISLGNMADDVDSEEELEESDDDQQVDSLTKEQQCGMDYNDEDKEENLQEEGEAKLIDEEKVDDAEKEITLPTSKEVSEPNSKEEVTSESSDSECEETTALNMPKSHSEKEINTKKESLNNKRKSINSGNNNKKQKSTIIKEDVNKSTPSLEEMKVTLIDSII